MSCNYEGLFMPSDKVALICAGLGFNLPCPYLFVVSAESTVSVWEVLFIHLKFIRLALIVHYLCHAVDFLDRCLRNLFCCIVLYALQNFVYSFLGAHASANHLFSPHSLATQYQIIILILQLFEFWVGLDLFF